MRETEEEREQMKNKAIRCRFRRATNGENSQGMNNIAIPDYVMRDFDVPETDTAELRYRTLRAWDMGEDSTQAHE